jgi:hypothetical protein
MNKQFILYEQALELKQLGFNEDCFGEWQNLEIGKNLVVDEEDRIYDISVLGADIKAPLYSQAFRWFREKKLSDSYIYRYQDRTDGSINFGYSIIHDYGIEEVRFIKENYTSYEEAELACLNKLIEIIKK